MLVRTISRSLLLLIVGLGLLPGCAQLRLPRIDPTGQRIFLPHSSYTTLDAQQGPWVGQSQYLPQPAFQQPAVPPVCALGSPIPAVGAPAVIPTTKSPAFAQIESAEKLIITPTRLVSPVGSEVVLLGGVCAEDGRYRTKQPVEWLLSQDSVGHFVGVGETRHPRIARLLNAPPRKQSSDFAITRTSTVARMITRGTASSNDDVWLKKGQSWVTVTSATAGTSHITAVAPGSENWEQRRQIARIHWVDARWDFPRSTIVKAGDTHELVTTVTRASDNAPSRDWIVRYEVVGGPEIGLGPDRERSYETRTDAEGHATAALQTSVDPATSHVKVQVLSPTLKGSDGQPVVVGERTTTITWSAPGLAVRVLGPEETVVDGNATYRIEVSNPGDLPTSGAELAINLGDTPLRFVTATPAPAIQTETLRWELGALQPTQTVVIDVTFQALREENLRLRVEATAFDARSATTTIDTRVVRSSLAVLVQQVEPDRQLFVGDQVTFNIEVRNIGRTPVTNVTVRDTFDLGLQHGHGEASPIVRSLGTLEPDQAQQFAVTFIATQPGQQCHVLEVTADGGHRSATQPACINVMQPQLNMQVSIAGPPQVEIDSKAYYEITVTNTGNGRLTGIRIVNGFSQEFAPSEASPSFSQPEAGLLVWDYDALIPGDSIQLAVEHDATALADAAINRLTVTADGGLTQTEDAVTRIVPAAQPDAANPTPPSPPAAASAGASEALNVTLSTAVGSATVGESVTYILDVENARSVADRDLVITFYLSGGVTFVGATSDGMPVNASVSPDGRAVSIARIREVRAGERLPPIKLEVRGDQPPTISVRAEVTSQRSPQPATASKDISISQVQP